MNEAKPRNKILLYALLVLAVIAGAGMAVLARTTSPASTAPRATLAPASVTASAPWLALPTPTPPQGPVTTDGIQLLVDGIPQPFEQGTILPVVGKIMGQLDLKPADANFLRNFDLFLFEETPNTPYINANVIIIGNMPDMPHGDFKVLAIPLGDGHYSVELPCGMNGQWEFNVQVKAEGKTGGIRILVDIYE